MRLENSCCVTMGVVITLYLKVIAGVLMSKYFKPEYAEDGSSLPEEAPDETIEKLRNNQRTIAYMAAVGTPPVEIAETMGMSKENIYRTLNLPKVVKEIKNIQDRHFGKQFQKYFEAMMPKTLDIAEEMLDDGEEKSNIKLELMKTIWDRTLGKSKQVTEIQGSILGDVIGQLDEMLARNVTPLDEPKDKMDNFLDDFIPDKAIVGKRGTDGEKSKDED